MLTAVDSQVDMRVNGQPGEPTNAGAYAPRRRCKRLRMGLLTLALALAVPAPALALSGTSAGGDASAAQYAPPGKCAGGTQLSSATKRCVHSPPSEVSLTEQAASTGSLPFTGYVLLSVVALGLLLLTGGLSLRRMARPRHPDAP